MNHWEEEDVVLKLVHTADWHLGKRFLTFPERDRAKLTRARLAAVERAFGIARGMSADAVLCAGDLFDDPDPLPQWWEPLAQKLAGLDPHRPVFLLPGNHDPLIPGSVYQEGHPFRRALPSWVHVVDRPDFTYSLKENAILYAVPCCSRSGQEDPTLAIPAREAGDRRIRIGMVHGSTMEIEDCQNNFPIARDAAARRGLDYLAIGDHHGYCEHPGPTVYPGTPEATNFGEREPGYVCKVSFHGEGRARMSRGLTGHWTWEDHTCRSLAELRALRDGRDRAMHVVRLRLEMRVSAPEYQEAERILRELEGSDAVIGRIGILQVERSGLTLDTTDLGGLLERLPPILQTTVERLKALEGGPQAAEARRAILHLSRLMGDQ